MGILHSAIPPILLTMSCKIIGRQVFYAIAKHDNPSMVIGMPAMTDKQIKLDIAKCIWRFGVVAKALKVLPPQEFVETLTEESLVYALLVLGVDVNRGQRVYALKTNASVPIPMTTPPLGFRTN